MKNNILKHRQESFLHELLVECFSNLNDINLSSLEIVKVECSKGKYNAKVFIESSSIDEARKREILKSFKKAQSFISVLVKQGSGWYRSPKLQLEFDNTLSMQNKLDNIFKQIKQDKEKT